MTSVKHQQGATLLVGLVMLIILTLIAIAAINTSTTNLKIVGNSQYRQDAFAAAQAAISQILSKGSYLSDPSTAPAFYDVNVNGETIHVVMARPCLLASIPIKVSELLSLPPADAAKCAGSAAQGNSGLMSQNTGSEDSECANVTWRITANVNNTDNKSNVQVVQGARLRMDKVLADTYKVDTTKRCAI